MSVRAQNWVWEHSPAAGTELLMLLALADAADDYGRNAFPSVATLARKTRMTRRSVQRLLARLVEAGHIEVRKAGGRRSNTYTLVLDPPPERTMSTATERGSEAVSQPPHGLPAESTGGVRMTPRRSDTPRRDDAPGVTRLRRPSSDTAMTPYPSLTRPSSSPAYPDTEPGVTGGGGGVRGDAETESDPDAILDALGPDWQLTKGQAGRLRRPVRQALEAGWTIRTLLPVLRDAPDGVRSPYAVLASRLADLPAPPAVRPARPPWCGECDEPTRMRDTSDGRAYRCPDCHPATLDRRRAGHGAA